MRLTELSLTPERAARPQAGPCEEPETASTASPPASVRRRGLRNLLRWSERLNVPRLWQPKARRLRVTETVSLGDKRFLSIVEVDGVSFLIGGGSASVSLLAPLGEKTAHPSFQGTLENAWGERETA